jgi:transglutaminase/protease-like cytokinesis protein 3
MAIIFTQASFISAQKPANEILFNHAKMTPDSAEANFRDLASYLKGPAQNDKEVVETIFYWVAINIFYVDDPSYEIDYPDNIAVVTLRTKKSGCEGTARLFHELCQAANIESEVVFGYAVGYSPGGRRILIPNHGWNVVRINNEWELVDATWGSGGSSRIGDSMVRVKEMDMRYLFADPEDFVIDHFPEKKKWQLLDKPVSKRTFYSDFYDLKRMAKHTKFSD